MQKIERILCPVDFSEFSAKAYDYAYSLARHYEAKLFLEHIISPVGATYPHAMLPDGAVAAIYWDLTADAEKRLTDMAEKRAPDGLQPEFVVHKGFVPETLLTLAEDQSADLIVMGTHGRRGWDRLMMGSVTRACSVLDLSRTIKEIGCVHRVRFRLSFSAGAIQKAHLGDAGEHFLPCPWCFRIRSTFNKYSWESHVGLAVVSMLSARPVRSVQNLPVGGIS